MEIPFTPMSMVKNIDGADFSESIYFIWHIKDVGVPGVSSEIRILILLPHFSKKDAVGITPTNLAEKN